MKILINTVSTKKHAGGAFQISLNYLLYTLNYSNIEWYYITSEDVNNAIGEKFVYIRDSRYFVFPTQPNFLGSYYKVKKQIRELEKMIKPDVIYTITAPSYFSFSTPEVMRFTNPWVTHPNKYAWNILSLKEKIFYFLYCVNQKRLMKKAHYFITQTETCAKGIIKVTGEPYTHVKVVNNVLPSVYRSIDNSPIIDNKNIHIACIGAATTHKNFDIIPDVLEELKKRGLFNVRFHVTLPTDEPTLGIIYKKLNKLGLRDMLVNHGRLSQKDLGELYRRCQFCFLPTLLEVFSASTVEAMYFKLPIVATDFSFNSDVLSDSCLYYEPKNAVAAAEQLEKIIHNKELQKTLIKKMESRLSKYVDYDSHFNTITDFLCRVAKHEI